MPVYGINDSPKFISGTYTRPYIVKNSGDNPVYLGQDSSLTVPTRAFSLPAGSTLNWSGDTELWAVTDGGLTGELELLFTGENSFTPGPSNLKLSSAITLLDTISLPYIGGASSVSKLGLPVEVSDYSSIILIVSNSTSSATDGALASTNYITLTATMYDLSAVLGQDVEAQWLLASSNFTTVGNPISKPSSLQIPVTNKKFIANVTINKIATPYNGTLTVFVFGSHESIQDSKYLSRGDGLKGTAPIGGIYTQTVVAIATTQFFIASRNGSCNYSLSRNAGSGFGGSVALRISQDGLSFQHARYDADGGTGNTISIFAQLPMRPIQLFITLPVAGVNSDVIFIQ